MKCSFALLPINALLSINNFATSKVSSPGTIALTTGILILGLVSSTIIALFNPAFFNLLKISLMSSNTSLFRYVLILENFIDPVLFFDVDDVDAGINGHFLLYISSFCLYCIFIKSSLEP